MNSGDPISKPNLYVLARIIKELRERNQLKRTTLATATGLSYDRLLKYLEWMSKKGFVKVDSNDNVKLTKLGVKTYDEFVKWILHHVGRLRFPKFK